MWETRARGPGATDHEVRWPPGATSGRRGVPQAALHVHERVDGAEDPLFILYTSAARGSPRASCTRPAASSSTPPTPTRWSSTTTRATVYFCAADVAGSPGTPTSSTAPSRTARSTVMFESTPILPDPAATGDRGRPRGQHLLHRPHRAPRLAHGGDEWVKRYRRDTLRVLGSVGEPINPEIWRWYHDVVGESPVRRRRHVVADGDGGHPHHAAARGDTDQARLGHPALLRRQADGARHRGRQGARGQRGERRPLPRDAVAGPGAHGVGRPPPLQGDLLHQYPGYYFTGDGVRRDEDGYYWITGRIDDVLQRLRPPTPGPHGRDRERPRGSRGGGGGGGGGVPPPDQGPGNLRLRAGERGVRRERPRPAPGRAQGAGCGT